MTKTNFADVSRFRVGSNTLKITPFFIKAVEVPGVSISNGKLPTRSGVPLGFSGDNISFEDLQLEVILDSGFETYFELLEVITSQVDFDQDVFNMPTFDLFIQVQNDKNEELFRFEFSECRINSLDPLPLNPEAEPISIITTSIS